MARLLAPGLETRLQARDQRIGVLALRHLRETHDLARSLGGEQALELPLILVAKLARVEAILERADELLRERDLTLVGSAVGVGRTAPISTTSCA